MQIAFLTLFLGLVNGSQKVVMDAGPGVAAAELLLDGHSVVVKVGHPPWTATVDLGSALLPHHLEARGLAADGHEISRTEQWLNLPRPAAEVGIVLEAADAAGRRTAHLTWDSLSGKPPTAVELRLDGEPLALDAAARAPLALPNAGAAHVLSARLRFDGGVEVRRELVLTGDYDDAVATELTAVPVRVTGAAAPGKVLTTEEVAGRFLAGGRPAKVTVVEREPPEVFVVRGAGAENKLLSLLMQRTLSPAMYGRFKTDASIRFHLVEPVARSAVAGATRSEIFDITYGISLGSHEVSRLLLNRGFEVKGRQQLADAVAVAGQHALDRQTPRAVVVLLGKGDDDAADPSRFPPSAVRAYLAAAGVPCFVWTTAPGSVRPEDWGPAADISTPKGLYTAWKQLEQELNAQQIVWVEGRYLPQSISLAPGSSGSATGSARGTSPAVSRLELVTTPPAPAE